MLEIFLLILLALLLSRFIEVYTKIPFILPLILLSYLFNSFFDLSILGENFEEIMYLMLPIILIPDVLGLSRSELKKNGLSIIYLAVIAVVVSIALAVGFTWGAGYLDGLSFFHLLILFTPLMATDVVSVGAIFSQFSLAKQLKLFAEGESLFNDITAMVIFFFIAIPILSGSNLDIYALLWSILYTLFASIFIGGLIGFLGYYSFKFSRNNFDEFISIYLMGSISFFIADKVELSGILSIVISVLLFKYFYDKEGHYKRRRKQSKLLFFLNRRSSSQLSFQAYKKEASYLGVFANAVVFISIANVIDIELLWRYSHEIFYVFIVTTVVRYMVIWAFVKYKKLPSDWTSILSLAGMKGGLALIMIVSLSDNFAYKEMFVTIVLGVVILSIFVYTSLLMLYMYLHKDVLIRDQAQEYKISFHEVKELLEKDSSSGAYNQIMFESFVDRELLRAQRYSYDFAIIALSVDIDTLHTLREKVIRKTDYLGKLDADTYAILLTHSDINKTIAFSDKLKRYIKHKHIAIAQYTTGDTKEILFEKLNRALQDKKRIDIEI